MSAARTILDIPPAHRVFPSPERLIAATTLITGVGMVELWSRSRMHDVTTAKTLVVAASRLFTRMAFPDIGRRVLGRTSHTTAVEAWRRFVDLAEQPARLGHLAPEETHGKTYRALAREIGTLASYRDLDKAQERLKLAV